MIFSKIIINIIILTCTQIYISTACTTTATATNYGGIYPSERRWEVHDPNNNIVASGQGGDTKTFCFPEVFSSFFNDSNRKPPLCCSFGAQAGV